MLGPTAEILHDPSNSHSGMIATAKWRENKPNEIIRVFEAEWDGTGKFPSDAKLIRNADECPPLLIKKIREHYAKLQCAITTGRYLDSYFADFEKYSDVFAVAIANGIAVKLPDSIGGGLDLSSELKAKLRKRK